MKKILRLVDWRRENLIPLNIPKCAVMHIFKCHSPYFFDYTIENIVLNKVTLFKDLGVIFDNEISFSKHIDAVSARCLRNLWWIKRQTKSFNDIHAIKCLFDSFILPHLHYSSSIWTPYYDIHLDKLEAVNRKFIRYLSYKDGNPMNFFEHNYSTQSLRYNIFTVESQHKLNDAMIAYKLIKKHSVIPILSLKFTEGSINYPFRTLRKKHT